MDEQRRVPARRVGWRMVPGVAVALVIILLVAMRRAEVPRIVDALRAARPIALGAGAGLSILWLCAYASMHAASQRLGGVRPSATRSLRLGVSSMMWNHITKSGGVAGAAPFVREGRQSGTPPGMVLAGYMFAMVVGEIAFALTLAIAFVVMAKHGSLTALEVGAAGVFALYVMARVALFAVALRSRERLRSAMSIPQRVVARWRKDRDREIDHSGADQLYAAARLVWERPTATVPIVVSAVFLETLGVALVWISMLALGAPGGVPVALLGYSLSVLFGIVGFLPGGFGFVEASLLSVLLAAGSTVPQAGAVVVVYRLFEWWLPVLAGACASVGLRRGTCNVVTA